MDMNQAFKDSLVKFGASSLAGYGAGALMGRYAHVKDGSAFEGIHHWQLGSVITPLAAVVPRNVKELPAGVGVGLIVHDLADLVKLRGVPPLHGGRGRPVPAFNERRIFKKYHIPNALPRRQKYRILTNKWRAIKQDAQYDPNMRDLAIDITRGIDGRDDLALGEAVQAWTWDNVEYKKDPLNLELFSYPQRTIKTGAGDCDDHGLVVASLLGAIGVPTVGLMYAQRRPKVYDHIMSGLALPADSADGLRDMVRGTDGRGNVIIPLETILTRPVPPGWEPPYHNRAVIHL